MGLIGYLELYEGGMEMFWMLPKRYRIVIVDPANITSIIHLYIKLPNCAHFDISTMY